MHKCKVWFVVTEGSRNQVSNEEQRVQETKSNLKITCAEERTRSDRCRPKQDRGCQSPCRATGRGHRKPHRTGGDRQPSRKSAPCR